MFARAGEKRWGVIATGYGVLREDDKNVLRSVVMIAQLYKFTKNK